MKTTENIKEILVEHRAELKKLFKVQEIGLFGSYVRDQQNESSDVDILVEFDEPIGLISFVGLKNYLSDLLGVEVDLVMKNALKPRIGKRILKEVVYV
ncbi:MAG: nucleotidyltransferase family protein [Methanosarcinaceae archaeon]|nr:nucleotidyltransferase family protein [Methanosarcinaceae archaeon]